MGTGFWDELPAVVECGMGHMSVPGLQLAVILNDEVVFSEAFGMADIENRIPMERTHLLPIGSTTKAFTAMAAAMLAAEKKLDFDVPVRRYLPGFELNDTGGDAQITLRDMLCHRTGLPRHDPMWIGRSEISRPELMGLLRHLPIGKPARSVWQYQNQMYAMVGHAVETVAGMPYEEYILQHILVPLGINRYAFEVGDDANYARLYTPDSEGQNRSTLPLLLGPMTPAGGLVTSAEQLIRWVRLVLNKGTLEGRALLPEALFNQLVRPHMPMETSYRFDEETPTFYTLGWETKTYRGRPLLEHGGNVFGASAYVSMLPGEKLGCVVLTNVDSTKIGSAIVYDLFDRFLDEGGGIDWFARYEARRQELKKEEAAEVAALESARVADTTPSHVLDDYCGTYSHPGYGQAVIGLEEGELSLQFHGFRAALRHLHYDHFLCELLGYTLPLSFFTGLTGRIEKLSIPFEPSVADIVFMV